GTDGNAPSITADLQPWAGDVGTGVPPLSPWVPGSPDVQVKNSKDPSVVTPPRYDTLPSADPLPDPAVVEGTWLSVRTGHQLIYLDGDRVLDWEPNSGHYRIWRYDRGVVGGGDPLPG